MLTFFDLSGYFCWTILSDYWEQYAHRCCKWQVTNFSLFQIFFCAFTVFGFHNVCGKKKINLIIINAESIFFFYKRQLVSITHNWPITVSMHKVKTWPIFWYLLLVFHEFITCAKWITYLLSRQQTSEDEISSFNSANLLYIIIYRCEIQTLYYVCLIYF